MKRYRVLLPDSVLLAALCAVAQSPSARLRVAVLRIFQFALRFTL